MKSFSLCVAANFIEHVRRLDSGCWEWLRCKNAAGYGLLRFNGRTWIASRFSWFRTFGEIPRGMDVLHHCDHPWCVNPLHLYLGTDKENAGDRQRRNRGRKEPWRTSRTKLDFKLAAEIRAAYVPGVTRYVDLAERFGVKTAQIGNVITGKCWP